MYAQVAEDRSARAAVDDGPAEDERRR
uniref:Uncharacterized protein n=1 Tax=Arundo donax TaxID=35708 RepID=A0A0A9CLJ9_ARUDO